MNNKNLLRKLMLFAFAACIGNAVMAQLPKVYVRSNITTNTTWTNNHIYVLTGYIYVTQKATLTIEPGTVIYGSDPTVNVLGALIVTRGSKIQAVGTPCRPIVFTSSKKPGKRARGDWGGVILLGYAGINPPGDTAHIEGITPNPKTLYGGGTNRNDADNSGTMEYVRIEFAGVALSPNNEINGLTLGGVGYGTTLDHIQVSYANDDSFEWFGGAVNQKYLIAYRGIDDDFDTDNGFSGKLQFGVALRDPLVADISKSHGFESDNDANGDDNTPQTRGVFSNITEDAGGDSTRNSLFEAGVYIRRNSIIKVYNSVVMGWPIGIYIDGTKTQDSVLTDTLVNNNIIAAYRDSNWVKTVSPSGTTDVIDLLKNHAGNRFYNGNSGVQLTAPYTLTAPNFRPKSTSPARSGANFKHAALQGSFFKPTTYVGAVSAIADSDWTKESWVNWTPVGTDYTNGAFGTGCPGFKQADVEEKVAEPNTPVADVKVSPNPNKGAFSVALNGFVGDKVNIKVSDLNTGKVYFFGKVNNNTASNIALHAPNGNYVVELSDGKSIITRKIAILN